MVDGVQLFDVVGSFGSSRPARLFRKVQRVLPAARPVTIIPWTHFDDQRCDDRYSGRHRIFDAKNVQLDFVPRRRKRSIGALDRGRLAVCWSLELSVVVDGVVTTSQSRHAHAVHYGSGIRIRGDLVNGEFRSQILRSDRRVCDRMFPWLTPRVLGFVAWT